jgi:3-hydroxyisobutyrate dehydrogenase-like beta-hydroxyacid dehydrogenase
MSRRTKKNIGVIGLGIIGSRVVETLRRKGFHVFVWNRTPRPVPNFVGSPPGVAEMCDQVQIYVSDDEALLEVINKLSLSLSPRHIVLAHSTVSPHTMRSAADIVERRGARFIEAPFTGSKVAAERGELVYYVSGDEVALRDARPILEASGRAIVEIGEIGQATTIKVATNVLTAAIVQAAAEGLALVRNSGSALEKFAEAMEKNASNSKTLSMKLPKMIQGDFEPHFSIKHMLKDMQIANRLGLLHHLELSVTGATRDRLLEQMQQGYGDDDFSAVVRKYLPEIRSPGEELADLELFGTPAPGELVAASTPILPESTAAVADNEVLPVATNSAGEEFKLQGEALPQSAFEVATSGVETGQSQSQSSTEAAPRSSEASLPTGQEEPPPPEEPVDEIPARRGLFSRLLRRGSG